MSILILSQYWSHLDQLYDKNKIKEGNMTFYEMKPLKGQVTQIKKTFWFILDPFNSTILRWRLKLKSGIFQNLGKHTPQVKTFFPP